MKRKLLPTIFAILLVVSSCGPVNILTRVKKIPREYSLNYCVEDLKAPKTDLNKQPWIVFSDREKNLTYNNAGGKVKAKDVDYLDAFLVIGTKGNYEYLELIKYTPEILKNGKLDYKNAEYYGWIHHSKLLLNQQSVTDIASGKKNKTLAIFGDTITINEPQKYFANDSIKLYKDIEFKSQVGTLAPYSVVYQMKVSEDGSRVLIAKKPYLKPEDVKNEVLGWVDNSLIKDIGTGLHVNLRTIPDESKIFLIDRSQDMALNEDIVDVNDMLQEQYKTIKFNPVTSYSVRDTLAAFKTRMPLPVFDYSNNYIFNVDGNPISHKDFREISRGLKKINISFVFEGSEQTISQFPQIVNALQNLQPLFENTDDNYSYQFGCVMNFDETGKLLRPLSFDLTSDYSQLVNFLSDKAEKKNKLRPIKIPRGSWSSLRKAIESFDKEKNASNLIVLIGDKKGVGMESDNNLSQKLIQNNCRIIGFQLYAGEGDDYNNFVLDIEDMINSYSDGMLKTKRRILVSPEQIKRENDFKQINEDQNNYRLDFPDRSITQGGLFFPQKLESLSMEVLTNNVDTIVNQMKDDNRSIVQYMSKAFRSVGNNRTQFDSLFVRNFGIDSARIPQKKFITSFIKETPGWYVPSKIIVLDQNQSKRTDYRLMLSDAEMKELKEFIASLSLKEVDFIYEKDKNEVTVVRKPCNCPEDDLFVELDRSKTEEILPDTIVHEETLYRKRSYSTLGYYANTSDVRSYLTEILLSPIKYCKLCKESKGKLKEMTLAQAQYRITGSPTTNEMLNSIHIKDLENSSIVSDKQLDELVIYFKKMKNELDKAEQFESNGEIYYWVDRKLLP